MGELQATLFQPQRSLKVLCYLLHQLYPQIGKRTALEAAYLTQVGKDLTELGSADTEMAAV